MFETDTPHVEIMVEVYAVIGYTTVQISRSGTDRGIALKKYSKSRKSLNITM